MTSLPEKWGAQSVSCCGRQSCPPVIRHQCESSKLHDSYVARYTCVDVLGCRGFGSLNIRPPRPGDPAGVDQVPAWIPVATSRELSLVAFSAASVTGCTAPTLCCSRDSKCPQGPAERTPQLPNFTGSQYARQPRLLHCSSSSWYLARFLS